MEHKIPIAKPYFDSAEEQAVLQTLQSGWISQGPRTIDFEQALADFVGVKYGRAANSGSSAIHLALLACGVKPADEVIVPAFTCVASLNPIEFIGARPILVDIDLTNFGLDIEQLPTAITPKTKAVIAVHLFGQAMDVQQVLQITSCKGIALIEDAALGLGARLREGNVGSFGDAACLSFHPRKTITTGEGGMVLTNSHEIAARVSELRSYGASVPAWERHQGRLFELPVYEYAGYNFKMTDIQAGIGLEQAKKLPHILMLRRQIALHYNQELADLTWLQLPQEPADQVHAYQSYVCLLCDKQDATPDHLAALRLRFWQHLADHGIASVQGAQSIPTTLYYHRKYGWKPEDFPMALRADHGSVALPIYPSMTLDEQEQVIHAVRSFSP